LKNPESELHNPHGVLFTEKYLLVANTHALKRPGTINVYRNDGAIGKPIQLFQTPFNHLREPHALVMRDGRLVITYCENVAPSGAVVSYRFNEKTGKITDVLDKTETWFSEYGDAKGICFSPDGTKIWVTFESDKQLSIVGKISRSLKADQSLPVSDRLLNLSQKVLNKFKKEAVQKGRSLNKTLERVRRKDSAELEEPNHRNIYPTQNGIVIFSISREGKIARNPDEVIVRKDFCRLENIHTFNDACVITDFMNHSASLYDFVQDPKFTNPIQIINLGKAVPHGAKFSPDGSLLVITSIGVKIVDQEPRFDQWESPREDKIFVLERAN